MSRNYANMSTARWRPETGYGRLTRDAQWAHYMLSTQPDISAAGVLPLNVKRWASRAANTTTALVVSALQELQNAGVILYDTETEELLIRGFVKDDGGYGNRKRRPVIERAAGDVESSALRVALAEDLAEVGLPVEWVGVTGGGAAPTAADSTASTSTSDNPAPHTPDAAFPQVDSLSDGLSRETVIAHTGNGDRACRSDGVAVLPQPSTHNPQPVPPSAAATGVAALAVLDQPALAGMPAKDPDPEPTSEQRAFGLARWWTKERAAANTPVVATGRTGPLHILKNLIQPFAEAGYTDDEIRAALNTLDQGVPSKSQLDTRLANQRRNSPYGQERSNGDLARRGTPPPAPRQSAGTRKAAVGLALGDELDRRYGTGGTR